LTLPLTRHWPFLSFFLDKNDYPREILLESIVRYVEERLLKDPAHSEPSPLNLKPVESN
jgi:hypothetical protein